MNGKNNELPNKISDYLTNIFGPKTSNYALIVLFALFAASSGTAYYFYSKTVTATPADQQAAVKAESKALVAQIGRLILLPDEEPTVATVSDPNALKNQPFFAKAKKGDRLLLYTTAKKAILYDPVDDKIVEVAPIVIGNPTTAAPKP